MTRTHQRLFHYIRNHRLALWIGLTLACLVGLLEAVSPLLFGGVFDTLLNNSAASSLPIRFLGFELDFAVIGGTTLLISLVVVTVLKAAAEYGSVTSMAWLGQGVVRDLRNEVFDRILHQPLR